MAVKRGRRVPPEISRITPVLKPLKLIVEPVLTRLERHENLLKEVKDALAIQLVRTADIQAQLDSLVARLPKKSS